MIPITEELEQELALQSDKNAFETWKSEILRLYIEGKTAPKGAFKRMLWKSGLIEGTKGKRIWTDRALEWITAELERKHITTKPHRSIYLR